MFGSISFLKWWIKSLRPKEQNIKCCWIFGICCRELGGLKVTIFRFMHAQFLLCRVKMDLSENRLEWTGTYTDLLAINLLKPAKSYLLGPIHRNCWLSLITSPKNPYPISETEYFKSLFSCQTEHTSTESLSPVGRIKFYSITWTNLLLQLHCWRQRDIGRIIGQNEKVIGRQKDMYVMKKDTVTFRI